MTTNCCEFRRGSLERLLGWVCGSACLLMASVVAAGTPAPGENDPNLVPNARLLGQAGSAGGVVNGQVPTAWRAFALDGAELSIESLPLSANALFPGSPATRAIRITVNSFGVDQGFDHDGHVFSLDTGRLYQPRVWVRTGNADDSEQTLNIGMPLFDQDLSFSGRDPASFSVQADSIWTQAVSPTGAEALPGETFAHLSFRLGDDGGQNSVWIALPEVIGRPVGNRVPNPRLAGGGGVADGNVSGSVPDRWRAFAVGDGTLTLTASELAADALYPGSPPTRSIRMEVTGSTAPAEGLDFELELAALTAGYRHWGELWVRSGHGANQALGVSLPLYDELGSFLGTAPGSMGLDVPPQWSFFAGPGFTGEPGQQVNIQLRLGGDGQGSIEIALPRVIGPADGVFSDRFQ